MPKTSLALARKRSAATRWSGMSALHSIALRSVKAAYSDAHWRVALIRWICSIIRKSSSGATRLI